MADIAEIVVRHFSKTLGYDDEDIDAIVETMQDGLEQGYNPTKAVDEAVEEPMYSRGGTDKVMINDIGNQAVASYIVCSLLRSRSAKFTPAELERVITELIEEVNRQYAEREESRTEQHLGTLEAPVRVTVEKELKGVRNFVGVRAFTDAQVQIAVEQAVSDLRTAIPSPPKRKIPAGSEDVLSMAEIVDGEVMVDFGDEFGHHRFYKVSTYLHMDPKKNPFTNALIELPEPTLYVAELDASIPVQKAGRRIKYGGSVMAGKTRRNTKAGGDIVSALMEIRDQVKLYHWQTGRFARHKATDDLVGTLDANIDKFVETYMGKYGRPRVSGSIKLHNFSEEAAVKFVDKQVKWMTFVLPRKLKNTDTDLLNIRDEILGDLNQVKYLFTLA